MPETTPTPDGASPPTILVVDDEGGIRELLSLLLETEGYRVLTAANGAEGLEIFRSEAGAVELVIQDLRMPGMSGLDLLRQLRSDSALTPVIVVTAFSTWDDAVEAMRLGAYNYIRKPFDTDGIRRIVRRALDMRAAASCETADRSGEVHTYRELIGNHPSIHDVLSLVYRVAQTESTVLVQGESGTGKEMIARAVHFQSHRRHQPFVAINCGAFPESLLESELFGHVRGAFTGAVEDKKGLFAVAEGGTVFLDEVGDMSAATQVKLLRVLEERKVLPVGGTTLVPIDVRIVAATNKAMEEEVRSGRFREDLYYRLNVIPLRMPALRDRPDDIPLLVGHFLAKYSQRMGKNVTGLSDDALRVLREHDWPGNVRELENIIQRHVALAETEDIKTIEIGPRASGSTSESGPRTASIPSSTPTTPVGQLVPPDGIDMEAELRDLERRFLTEALEMTGGHMTKAAKLLGMSYRSIRYRIKKLGLRESTTTHA